MKSRRAALAGRFKRHQTTRVDSKTKQKFLSEAGGGTPTGFAKDSGKNPESLAKLKKDRLWVKKPLDINNRLGYSCPHESTLPQAQDTLRV